MEQVSGTIHPYITFLSANFRFLVSIPPDRILFNQEVAVDHLGTDGRPHLHTVDIYKLLKSSMALR